MAKYDSRPRPDVKEKNTLQRCGESLVLKNAGSNPACLKAGFEKLMRIAACVKRLAIELSIVNAS